VKKADEEDGAEPLRWPERGGEHASLLSLQAAMPESDPAYPILAGILGVVPASRWTFARVESNGDLVSLFGSHPNGAGLAALADEFRRQRANFGILTLLRTTDLGPFTSSEISVLTFALDALSNHLSALRLQPPSKPINVLPGRHEADLTAEAPEGAFYVLDSDLQIVLAWTSEDQRRIALTGLHTRIAERLPKVLEETVRELTSAWSNDSVNKPSTARPVPFLVVRTQPMSGPAGLFIGVRIDRFQPPNSLTGAASRFHISPREVQVLALLLDGNHLDQIGKQLSITSSTVQDHIKSMLDKTGSSNRSELIARVLGWESTPSAFRT